MFLSVTKSGQYQLVGMVLSPGTDWTVTDDNIAIPIPEQLSGLNLTSLRIVSLSAGVTGTGDVQLSRKRAGSEVDMLSTVLTIDTTELSSDDAATPYVINESNDDVLDGDIVLVDTDAIHSGTAAKGMCIWLTFG